jgi:hypothetical protein
MSLRVRLRVGLLLFLSLAALPAVSRAQAPSVENVEVEPLACWWRTRVASVRVGEPFALVLTCSVLETDAVKAVVDRSRLGSASVQFPPFEVIGGSQAEDRVTPGRRFMQYEYQLRLVNEDSFGRDIGIPELEISYRIESRVKQDAAVQGREQTYVLQPLPLRVASLVPDTARHIRESAVPTLTDIAGREFRARMLRLIALILFGVAALMLVVAVLRWLGRKRAERSDAERHLLPHRAVLSGVRGELRAIQQETRGGWTQETVLRALVAARIVGSYLAGHPVSQRPMTKVLSGGELELGGGMMSRRRVAVSGATTAASLNRGTAPVPSDLAASDLDSALLSLTRAHYGRIDTLDGSALDEAVATTSRAAARVASRHTWLAETMVLIMRGLSSWMPRAWAR